MRAGWFAAALAVLAIPAFVAAVDWLPKIGAFDKETNLGNLIGPLSGWQLFGIWPVGDFRVDPHDLTPVYVLVAVVVAAGVGGLWWAWRRRAWGLLVYVTTAVVGCLDLRRDQLAVGRREDARDGLAGRARGGAGGGRRAAHAQAGRGGRRAGAR